MTSRRLMQLLLLVAAAFVFTACGNETPHNQFSGRLSLDLQDTELQVEVLTDWEDFASQPDRRTNTLPDFDFAFFQHDDVLLPAQRGPIAGDHPHWEFLLAPGSVAPTSSSDGFSKVSLPFALIEKNANCIHNGVLRFRINTDGAVSNASISVASETCMYFKLNIEGEVAATYTPGPVPNATAELANYQQHRAAQIPTRPITELATRYPDADLDALANAKNVNSADMTTYGLVLDGVHYRGACSTRKGDYPFCEQVYLPSYSTAKSLYASLALMRLEKRYPGAANALVSRYVPACAGEQWRDVRFIDLLDMASGNYDSAAPNKDETDPRMDPGFFYPERHADKIAFSCNVFPRRSDPGTVWTYHTTDTYILSTAMTAFLREREGPQADTWRDLIQALWQPLQLSPLTHYTRRSLDERGQPWAGFGLVYQPDDIARLALALGNGDFDELLDPVMLDQALQRGDAPQGLPAGEGIYYTHGFYALNLGAALQCDEPLWIPVMSGYGGLAVAVLPGDMTYYYFSDGGAHSWTPPLRALHALTPLC